MYFIRLCLFVLFEMELEIGFWFYRYLLQSFRIIRRVRSFWLALFSGFLLFIGLLSSGQASTYSCIDLQLAITITIRINNDFLHGYFIFHHTVVHSIHTCLHLISYLHFLYFIQFLQVGFALFEK
jgi:hypothetical protein